jgi:hypothetical protein
MAKAKRVRDAGTGKIVKPEEAAKRPKETVTENPKNDGLAARVALLEAVIEEGGGNLARLFRRRKAGLTD